MGHGLSNKDVAALNTAITILLAPLSLDESDGWRRAVGSAVEVLQLRPGSNGHTGRGAGFLSDLGFARRKALLNSFIESAPIGIILYSPDGWAIQENKAMGSLLANDPEGMAVRTAARQVALQVTRNQLGCREPLLPCSPVVAEMRTTASRYRVRATFVENGVFSGKACTIAIIERVTTQSLNSRQVATAFGLTNREAETARLMGRGCSNREIARSLGISVNTARRHSERVLSKLDVHSRAEAAVRLNGS